MRYTHDLDSTGRPEWLAIIHAVNAIRPETFGKPIKSGPWWAGGECEEYESARIIFREDGSVSIVAKPNRDEMDAVQAALDQAHREVTGHEWPRS